MLPGNVDLRLGVGPLAFTHEPQKRPLTLVQNVYIGEKAEEVPHLSQSHELFCVEDLLNLPGLNTTFNDTCLEEHLFVSSISNQEDWILCALLS